MKIKVICPQCDDCDLFHIVYNGKTVIARCVMGHDTDLEMLLMSISKVE